MYMNLRECNIILFTLLKQLMMFNLKSTHKGSSLNIYLCRGITIPCTIYKYPAGTLSVYEIPFLLALKPVYI